MATYHLSVKTISRAAGRSATAAAAYRAGALIADERTGDIHDYTRKAGVMHAELVLPVPAAGVASTAAPHPAWAADRAALWNAAEAAENRKNSTVAREFEIALPAELTAAQRQALAMAFASELVAKHGFVADVAIHAPGKEGDHRNHHAHILCSTRRLSADGFTEKTRELDDRKSGIAEVHYWRERWAVLQNQALEQAGQGARVTHLAHSPEQIAAGLEPTRHLGPDSTEMERRGIETRAGDHNRAVLARNAEQKGLQDLIAQTEGQIQVLVAGEQRPEREPAEPAAATTATTRVHPPLTPAQEAIKLDQARERLASARQQRLLAIEQKAQIRETRRIDRLQAQRKIEPQPPTGMTAILRQKGYVHEHDRWRSTALRLQQLAQQARALRQKLSAALAQVKHWVEAKLQKQFPAPYARAVAYQADQAAQRTAGQRPSPADAHRQQQARLLAQLARRIGEGQLTTAGLPAAPLLEAAHRYQALRKGHTPEQAETQLVQNLIAEAAKRGQEASRDRAGTSPRPALLERMAQALREQQIEATRTPARPPAPLPAPNRQPDRQHDQDQDLER